MIKTTVANKQKKKTSVKKDTNETYKKFEKIVKDKLSKMSLSELSVSPYTNQLIFSELERRIKLIQSILKKCQNMYLFDTVIFQVITALNVIEDLLKNPQVTRR